MSWDKYSDIKNAKLMLIYFCNPMQACKPMAEDLALAAWALASCSAFLFSPFSFLTCTGHLQIRALPVRTCEGLRHQILPAPILHVLFCRSITTLRQMIKLSMIQIDVPQSDSTKGAKGCLVKILGVLPECCKLPQGFSRWCSGLLGKEIATLL